METLGIAAARRSNGWTPIRRELDVQSFGINAWHADDGGQLVGEHAESNSGQEELYIVIEGAARFTVLQRAELPRADMQRPRDIVERQVVMHARTAQDLADRQVGVFLPCGIILMLRRFAHALFFCFSSP